MFFGIDFSHHSMQESKSFVRGYPRSTCCKIGLVSQSLVLFDVDCAVYLYYLIFDI
jgi:hypothetical protein